MGKKGRRFLDKRRDVLHTFKVVSRSQRDPLVADPAAPQAVLQPALDQTSHKSEQEKYGIFFDDDYDYLQHLRGVREAVDWDEEDLEVYTIRREDPQAGKKELRGKKLLLPSSAFESFVEEPIGLLNKAAPLTGPRPELDPDVVAGLDDEGDMFNTAACTPEDEDALPDDFVMMLNAEAPVHLPDDDGGWEDWEEEEEEEEEEGEEEGEEGDGEGDETMGFGYRHLPALSKLSSYREKGQDEGYDADQEEKDFSSDFNDSEDEGRDEVASLEGPAFPRPFPEEEDTPSHFTSYSLTSSVLPRRDHLTTLDDCFEEKYVREYREEQVGALDGEDIEGFVEEDSPLFHQALQHSRRHLQEDPQEDQDQDRIVRWIKDMQRRRVDQQQEEEKEEVEVTDDEGEKERWDCETILTLNSTLYHHPRTICDPPRRKKIAGDPHTGTPLEPRVSGLTRRNLAHHDKAADPIEGEASPPDTPTLITSMSAVSIRPPGETSEERRWRKKALKELRRERRLEKKVNRAAFKSEKKRQEKVMMNNRYNNKISLV